MSTFIVFAEDWQRHPSSSQHLLRQLKNRHHVIWVNSIGLRSPGFNGRDWRRLWQKVIALSGCRPATERDVDNQAPDAVISPLCLPFHQFTVVRWLNRQLLRWQIRQSLQALQLDDESLILWLALPSAVCIAGALGERQIIYYCGDDFSALAGVDHQTITRLERHLVDKAQWVLCASPALVAKFQRPHCLLLSHGVDLALFSQQWPRPALLTTTKPVALFYGLLADWFDTELMMAVARDCPQWQFVLIGQQQTDLRALAAMDNVQLIDAIPHDCLVQYACHSQALLLPFRQCQQIDYCNPLKLKEYLAVGKPILSVPFPALVPFQHCVMSSTQSNDWVQCLTEVASWDYSTQLACQTRNRQAVAQESWEQKAHQIDVLLTPEASVADWEPVAGRLS